ncbi:MAG TPA: tail fiber domain-containing protein [Rhizomicrobium sp.]|nr:tail fiber domain-containing protein [Rhizomicrobium sp.]
MADTTTTNYGWTKPEVGASNNSWGVKLNLDLDNIDSKVKEISDASKVASNLTSGTVPSARGGAGTVNGLLKANGSGTVSQAVSGSDYAPATSGSSILKGNGSGGFANAVSGTDYCPINGSGASGTWGISISGNAATATSATLATSANQVANAVTFNNSGAGGAPGSNFNGSGALLVSYNTIGAPSTTGAGSSGTWGINITGGAASATTAGTANALNTGNNYQAVNLTLTGGLSVAGGTATGALTVTGAITATGNITAFSSDDRLKIRTGTLEGALDKLCALDTFMFKFNELALGFGLPEGEHMGLSAQQVQAVYPCLATKSAIPGDFLTLFYQMFAPAIIEALKELRAEVRDMKGMA